MGEVPKIVPKSIAANILGCFNIKAEIAPSLKTPEYAYDKGRLQYNAGLILNALESLNFSKYEKVIAVLNVDLFVPIFTYVFGEARQGGMRALVSVYRLIKKTDASAIPEDIMLQRAAKVALHEMGHLFDLVHCMDDGCLMNFSGGLEDLDKAPLSFCRYCSRYLRDALSLNEEEKGAKTLREK